MLPCLVAESFLAVLMRYTLVFKAMRLVQVSRPLKMAEYHPCKEEVLAYPSWYRGSEQRQACLSRQRRILASHLSQSGLLYVLGTIHITTCHSTPYYYVIYPGGIEIAAAIALGSIWA